MTSQVRDWLILAIVAVVSSVALWLPIGMRTIYQNFDGPYYLVVAKSWYDKATIGKLFSFPIKLEYYPAHFPLYPMLIKPLDRIGLPRAMVLVNLVATIACAVVLYEIVRVRNWGNPLWVSLIWLFFWPRMWVVRSVGSPETLFTLFILLSLHWFDLKKYWWAAIAGSLAVLTKSPGILLFPTFLIAGKFNWKIWPILLIPASLLLLFTVYSYRVGDFWAYFNSGDNIHLQALPFKIFDSSQSWVGTFWLEDVIWIYIAAGLGVYYCFKKSAVWGWFGAIFYATILFVSHRDISRYALPLTPLMLIGLSHLLNKKEIRWALALAIIPIYFYSLNFLSHNTVSIADWTPFFAR